MGENVPEKEMTESEIEAKAKEAIDEGKKASKKTIDMRDEEMKPDTDVDIEAKAKEMGYSTTKAKELKDSKIIGKHTVEREDLVEGELRPKGWEQGDKEKTLAEEIKEKLAAAPDEKMPTKNYKKYVNESIDTLKQEELEMMKKSL